MVDSHVAPIEEATELVRRVRTLLANNQTAAAGQVIHLLRLKFPDHPELETLEEEREALYHPTPEQVSFLEDTLQTLPSAQILGPIGGLIVGAGLLTFIAKEPWIAVGVILFGALVLLLAVFRSRVEDSV